MQPLAALFNCHARIHTHTHFCKYMHARTPHRHIRSLSIKALNWETVLQALALRSQVLVPMAEKRATALTHRTAR